MTEPKSRESVYGRRFCRTMFWALGLALTACGGGGGGGGAVVTNPPFVPLLAGVRISDTSPYSPGCDAATSTGTLYEHAEVEPSVAVNALNPANIVAGWQQDRRSDGGSHGLVTAASFDGGRTWTRASPDVSRCAGGSAATASDYERASDPWLTFSADGTAFLLSLSFSGSILAPGSASAMLVARSSDGGVHWGTPTTLIADGAAGFNDKGSISGDPTDPLSVYAVWDRLSSDNRGPSYFTRTRDAGLSWEPARAIYDPGVGNQTIGNLLIVLPGGALLVVFTELDGTATGTTAALKVIRSDDRGNSWGAPISIADEHATGTRDPGSGALVRDGNELPSIAVDRGGAVYVVWQDSRFSGGARDGIALTRSLDGGLTWSTPAQVNGAPAVAAFTPTVRIRDDGVVGVSYYDLRNLSAATGTQVTDYWLATSMDALSWHDTHVSGPFLLATAPNAEGLFLGDYQGLGVSGNEFLPVFVAVTGDLANRTDVFVVPIT